jgi:hypothetical protein
MVRPIELKFSQVVETHVAYKWVKLAIHISETLRDRHAQKKKIFPFISQTTNTIFLNFAKR